MKATENTQKSADCGQVQAIVMPALVFAMDFDDTFTADAVLWSQWITHAQSRGHQVYCVTARRDTDENRATLGEWFKEHGVTVPTVFTSLASKVWAMEKRGIKVNVWIDDSPLTLVNGH